MRNDTYDTLDRMLQDRTRLDVGFGMLVAQKPIPVSHAISEIYGSRYERIKKLFDRFIAVLRDALDGELAPVVLDFLLGDSLPHAGREHHNQLLRECPSTPVFFRTDDPVAGRACEIQCPGSTWGEYALLEDFYGSQDLYDRERISERFASDLDDVLKGRSPVVHHLLDNSSMPGTMVYFLQQSRPHVRYAGYDRGVMPRDCNFVRSHSVYGLMAENHFSERLSAASRGELVFDLPPNLLFDSKAPLALPFWSQTRHYFTEQDRLLICRAVPVLPDGIEIEEGHQITIDDFAALPRSQRRYYLKYAGADVALNWGSRAVYRLSNDGHTACRTRLRQAVDDFTKGRPWVVQAEEASKEVVTYFPREGGVRSERKHVGLRAFHGPSGLLGLMTLYRDHYKVHGQDDTIAAICE